MRRLPTRLRAASFASASALVAAIMLAVVTGTPARAQTFSPSEDTQIIDLGTALEAPDTLATDVEVEAPPTPTKRHVEIADGDLLTLPEYSRTVDLDDDESSFDDVLLPLQSQHPTLAGIVRLTGEVQSEGFFVDLPLAASARDLVLAYRIAINVLPEQSELHIRVNGTDLEPVMPSAFEGFEELILPSELLIAGRNEISVRAHQSHRIFCGPEASFAVWTEINTNTSGVRLRRTDLPVTPVGLRMALGAQVAISGVLPVSFLTETDEGFLDGLAPRLAGLRDGSPVRFDQQSPYSVAYGPAQMARITILPGDGAPFTEIRRAADDAIVLVLTQGIDGSMPDLNEVLPLPGPIENIAALHPGFVTTLRDLAFDQTDAFNRYSEQEVTFALPDDWLILASQRAELRLDYTFADGLPKGAIMLVKLNETTVRLLPLDRNGGKALPTLEIDFPARILVPGANALTFVAIIPGDPPEEHCPPLTGPLLTIGAQSTMFVPPSPKMRMLGIDRPLIAMRPDQVSTETVSSSSERIAGGLMATVAAALRPVAETKLIADASLTVAYGSGLGQLDLEDLGITRRELTRLLTADRTTVPNEMAQVKDMAAPQPGLLVRIGEYFSHKVTQFKRLAIPGDGPLASWLENRHAEAVLFIPDDDAPEALWLMVNQDINPGRVAAILAQARLSAHGPKGRLSVLTHDGNWQNWHTTRTAPVLLEPLGVANFREVAGNYASWSPLYYCLVLLCLTLVSACLALVYIVTTRGSKKR